MNFVPQYSVARVLKHRLTPHFFAGAPHETVTEPVGPAHSREQAADLARLDRQLARERGLLDEDARPRLVAHRVTNNNSQKVVEHIPAS